MKVMIGVDPHKVSHTAVAIDASGLVAAATAESSSVATMVVLKV